MILNMCSKKMKLMEDFKQKVYFKILLIRKLNQSEISNFFKKIESIIKF